jgi:hypothetical protein
VLLSEASVASQWVKMELFYALTHSQYSEKILPVTLEECDFESLSWTLGAIQMIDLEDDENTGFEGILNSWGYGFDPDKAR